MQLHRLQRDILQQLLTELQKANVSPDKLLSMSALPGAKTGDPIFSGIEAIVMLEAATKLTRNPSLAIRLGQAITIDSYETLGFALMSCANMRESIELLLRYGKIFDAPLWESHKHEDGLLLRLKLSLGTPAQQQLCAELCFSQVSAIGSSLYRGQINGAQIHFKFPKPANASSHLSALSAPLYFDCEHNELFLPHDVLDTPVKTADASNHVVFNMQCEEMLNGLTSAEEITSSVRQLLMESAGHFLDISQVADRLHMSERTLRRRLKEELTNFKAVLEEIKNLLAKKYLSQTDLSVADIAHLLDYAETVNFRRAFKRWNGAIPSQYRQQNV
jgi:AraC-like DNA-binding protein